jgi:hypothetical protein
MFLRIIADPACVAHLRSKFRLLAAFDRTRSNSSHARGPSGGRTFGKRSAGSGSTKDEYSGING